MEKTKIGLDKASKKINHNLKIFIIKKQNQFNNLTICIFINSMAI